MSPQITALIAIVIGLLFCFAGYKIQKMLITIVWFALGFMFANKIGGYFISSTNLLLVIEIIVGIIVGSLGYKLEKLALCIAVAYLVYITIGPYIKGFEKEVTFIIHIGVSLLVGILSTLFIKPILIVVSSIAGANIIKYYLPTLITLSSNVLLIVVIVIAILGILAQFKIR